MCCDLTTFIQNNYNIHYQTQGLDNFSSADVILIGETHNEKDLNRRNIEFINQFAKVVLLEIPSVYVEKYAKFRGINQSITLIGWDDLDSVNQINALLDELDKQKAKFKALTNAENFFVPRMEDYFNPQNVMTQTNVNVADDLINDVIDGLNKYGISLTLDSNKDSVEYKIHKLAFFYLKLLLKKDKVQNKLIKATKVYKNNFNSLCDLRQKFLIETLKSSLSNPERPLFLLGGEDHVTLNKAWSKEFLRVFEGKKIVILTKK